MKNVILAMMALGLMIGLFSCDGKVNNNTTGPESIQNVYNSDAFQILEDNPEAFTVEDATLNNEFDCTPYDRGQEFKGKMRGHHNRHWAKKDNGLFRHGLQMGRVLRDLQLTESQLADIKDLFLSYFDCKKQVWEAAKPIIKSILESAATAREDIKARLESGEITRAEAMQELRDLNADTREKIHEAVDQDALCNCLQELLDGIENVLDEEQKATFDEWRDKLEGPCFDTGE